VLTPSPGGSDLSLVVIGRVGFAGPFRGVVAGPTRAAASIGGHTMKKIRAGTLHLSTETLQRLTSTTLDHVIGGAIAVPGRPLTGSAGSACPSIQLPCPGSGNATCTLKCAQ
jgi:hypothetical protein